MINCWQILRPLRHQHYGHWHRHLHWHVGHSHLHIFAGIVGAVGAAAGVIVCAEIGPGLWGPAPHSGQPYGGPGLGPEEFSGAPVPFIGGPGVPFGIVNSELEFAASSVPSAGNGSGTIETNQIENQGTLPSSIEMGSTPAVGVIGQVPEPSSASMLIGPVLAMALLRVRRSRRPLTRARRGDDGSCQAEETYAEPTNTQRYATPTSGTLLSKPVRLDYG